MKTSLEGQMALASHEGIVLDPYLDSKGIWTIGVGHTAAAGYPNPKGFSGHLTLAEALGLFKLDVAAYERAVSNAVTIPLAQHEFDALVSFHYNTGAIAKASFVKKLNAGDRAGAMKGMMDWRKPPEIIPRRTAERDLFKTGKYPAPFGVVYRAIKGKVQWGSGTRLDLRTALTPAKPVVVPPKPIIPGAPEPDPPPAGVKTPQKHWLTALIEAIKALLSALFGRK